MFEPDSLMDFLGIVFLIGSAYLILSLIFRKYIWNYPVVASIYIMFSIVFAIFGIVLIMQIELSDIFMIIMGIALAAWTYITSKLPAKKEEKTEKIETNKGT